MSRIRILLGRSRWRRRRALPLDGLAGIDPHGRPTFTYLTDTWRKRQVVEREFRDRDCFTAPVRVLGELFHDLWLRHGDGSAVLTARSEAVLAERLLVAQPGRWPWLESLGRPSAGGEALAGLAASLDEAGMAELPTDARNGSELMDAVRALREAWGQLDAHLPRARAVKALIPLLEQPSPALERWLQRSKTAIVDDVLQPSPLRTAALIALCRVWAASGATVIVCLASGRDLGGREAGFFFEYDEDAGYPLKPFAATRALRRALFDAWIASGEAEIYAATADRAVLVEPGSTPEPAGAPDLSDFVYGDSPLPAANAGEARAWLMGRVRLLRCAEPTDELRWIARSVRQTLDRGARPTDCVVAWPGLEADAAGVRAVFADFGIPIAIGAGDPVDSAPVARALVETARLPLDGWPCERLLALADLAGWPLPIDAGELGRLCAAAGVRGGHPRSWFPTVEGVLRRSRRGALVADLGASLEQLAVHCAAMALLVDPGTPAEWRDRLLAAADAIGLGALAATEDRTLMAWGAALGAVDELVVDLAAIDPGPWQAAELTDHLERAIAAARWRPETHDPERVGVVGVLELRGLSPRHTWLGGLVRGRFPRPSRLSAVVDRELARRLEPVDALAEARYLLHAALRNALDDPSEPTLVLSWSSNEGGRPLAPSPVLADLLALPTTGGAAFGDLVVEQPGEIGPPYALSEVVRGAAVDRAWASQIPPRIADRLARHRARESARAQGSRAWNGDLPHPPSAPTSLSVTALEQLVRCPARYWFDRVLALESDDPWSPELEPRRRGTAIHRILQRFVEQRAGRPVPGGPREAAAAELHDVATAELDAVEAEGGFEPALQAWARGRWLAGLVDGRPNGILGAWLEQEIAGDPPLEPIGLEQSFDGLTVGGIQLRGQLDRLDRHPSGVLLVTDYKTGNAPAGVRVTEGLALQPLVYALAAQRHTAEPVAAAYLTLKRADDVRRVAWTGDAAALDQLTPARERARAIALDSEQRAEILDGAAAKAVRALAGDFRTTELDAGRAGCATCPHARICRVAYADQALDPGVQG